MKNYILIVFILISNSITGLLNQIYIAKFFGASRDLDILNLSSSMPNAIMSLALGAINLSLLPILIEKYNDANYEGFIKNLESKLFRYGTVLISLISIIQISIFWIKIPIEFRYSYVFLTMISSCFSIISLVNSIYSCWANIKEKFILTSFNTTFLNITSILFCYFFGEKIGVYSIAISLLMGITIWLTISKNSLFENQNKSCDNKILFSTNMSTYVGLFSILPSAFFMLIDNYFLSKTIDGSLSIANYANKINNIFALLIIQPINLLLYPPLNKLFIHNRINEMEKMTSYSFFFVIYCGIISYLITENYLPSLVKITLVNGSFSLKDANKLIFFLKISIFGVTGVCLMNIVYRLLTIFKLLNIQITIGILFLPIYFLIEYIFYEKYILFSAAISFSCTWLLFSLFTIIIIIKLKFNFSRFFKFNDSFILLLIIFYFKFYKNDIESFSNIFILIALFILVFTYLYKILLLKKNIIS